MLSRLGEKWRNLPQTNRDRSATILTILIAVVIAIFVTLFVFQSYRVDGQSMDNTLANNDRLIIYKLPRTLARLTGRVYIPHRGDIIVFNESGLFGGSTQSQLIKRVIGLPGDRVVIGDGKLRVYNSSSPKGFNPDAGAVWANTMASSLTSGSINLTLSANQLFVMGDNRPGSEDSRDFGPINLDQIIGKLNIRILPLSKSRTF